MKYNNWFLSIVAAFGLLFTLPQTASARTVPEVVTQVITQVVTQVVTNTVTNTPASVAQQTLDMVKDAGASVKAGVVATVAGVSSTTKAIVTNDTVNAAVIDILHGVKTASSDIYNASKTAITKSVDFTMEQAPLVVNEFLHWKFAEATVWLLFWVILACVFFGLSRTFNLQTKEGSKLPDKDKHTYDKTDAAGWKWACRFIAFALLLIGLTTQGLVMTKIAVAPRVYVIEYVVSTIHNGAPPSQ